MQQKCFHFIRLSMSSGWDLIKLTCFTFSSRTLKCEARSILAANPCRCRLQCCLGYCPHLRRGASMVTHRCFYTVSANVSTVKNAYHIFCHNENSLIWISWDLWTILWELLGGMDTPTIELLCSSSSLQKKKNQESTFLVSWWRQGNKHLFFLWFILI